MKRSNELVLLLFFCSGATALIYEIIWSKYLALMFGSTIQAQTVVLAVFMGGLALGNFLIGRRSDLMRQPLATYGYIEGIIGLYAFFFNVLHDFADRIFISLGTGVFGQTTYLLILKGLLSVGLLIGPTVLMGGTLPLLCAWLQKASPEAGRQSARFYSINSLGAVAGSALAGFVLVRELGLVLSLQLTGLANVLIGNIAVALARRQAVNDGSAVTEARREPSSSPASRNSKLLLAGAMVACTGGISMGLEVLASRSLSLIFGGSLQAFALVLISFILGIGLGSAFIASKWAERWQSEFSISYLLAGAACCVGFFIYFIEEITVLYTQAKSGLGATEVGYIYHQILISLISLTVLGIPAALLGAVLPLWIRILSRSTTTLGDQVGHLLTWNTLGAVLGVLFTGFWLMPTVGLRGALGTFAIVLAVMAAAVAWLHGKVKTGLAGAVLAALLLSITLTGGEAWKQVLSSAIFRVRNTAISREDLNFRKDSTKILFYEDAPDATVSIETSAKETPDRELTLRINGKPDASTRGDLSTQYLVAHLPMLAKPDSKDVFVLGFGSGITAGALLGHPIEKLVIAENCKPILKAAKIFEPWNRGVLTNERTILAQDDARAVLKLNSQKYDILISEPSNPWVAGIGSVFSQEFYKLAASRLKDGGIMAQWFHIYEVHDGIVFLVLRTFATVFPHIEIWDTSGGDIILLGSKQPWKSTPESFAKVLARQQPNEDLREIGVHSPELMFSRQIASQRTAFAIPGNGPIESDAFPILEHFAHRAFYIGATARNIFAYDERTWQSVLLEPWRRDMLRPLTNEQLEGVFSEFTSCNSDLQQFIMWRTSQQASSSAMYPLQPAMPVVFRSPQSYSERLALPRKTSPELRRLEEARTSIQIRPENWKEGIETIEAIIQQHVGTTGAQRDWQPHVYAVIAAKARIANGDFTGARRIIELGLKANPHENLLLYLQRILDREQSAPGQQITRN